MAVPQWITDTTAWAIDAVGQAIPVISNWHQAAYTALTQTALIPQADVQAWAVYLRRLNNLYTLATVFSQMPGSSQLWMTASRLAGLIQVPSLLDMMAQRPASPGGDVELGAWELGQVVRQLQEGRGNLLALQAQF